MTFSQIIKVGLAYWHPAVFDSRPRGDTFSESQMFLIIGFRDVEFRV